MRIRCKYKMRFFLHTIESILSAMIPKRKLERLVIKQLNAHFCHSLYKYIFTSSGRSALALLFESLKNDSERKCHSVLLPDYLCNVVQEAAKFSGLKIRIYMTDNNYKPVVSDICKKLGRGGNCVLLASIFGRINNEVKIVKEIRAIDPQCVIIYDECQNLIGAKKIVLDRNSFIVLSFNNKMTPGLLGGMVVSMDDNNLLKVRDYNNVTSCKYNAIMLIAYLKQNLKILFHAVKAIYPEPSAIEFSLCQGKYSVRPEPMSRISISAAYVALKNLTFHHKVLVRNNKVAQELQKRGFISIQGKLETGDAPYIPVVNHSNGSIPMKGRYGSSCDETKEGTENCIILSNSFLYTIDS